MKNILYISVIFIAALQSCSKDLNWVEDGYTTGAVTYAIPAGAYVPDNSFKIVAYYAEANEPDSIGLDKYKMITHLHYAFAYPNADGTLKALAKPANFTKVMKLAKENGVKRAISLAGSESIYSALAADPVLRKTLVNNIMAFVLKNDLDGVDIDWEYPRSNFSNDITYEAFMKDLSARLHVYHKYLSSAVTAGLYAGSVKDGINKAAIDAMDFVNLMAYDGANWKSDPNHSSYIMAGDVLDVWFNEKGLTKEKAVLGFPAYGKNAANAAMTYRNLLANKADPMLNIFTMMTGATPVTYYYNGIPLIKEKTALAYSRANGIMVWELSQDANGANSLIKAAKDKLGELNVK
ncbi:chitinase [Pedobacter sp. MC2016-14]|uniref:glycosyl hydrolase family 18 protein n=1 Tax=Pedobacter sp. MC2016-14 TaxID=2897327 RepID=UPI001E406BD4|nr:glycosyl hydrolase family 18 protein [Pedobacter sp. MC2016-14]MCD0487457.1 chitinase [Pedobacter sp. MC2016-14]